MKEHKQMTITQVSNGYIVELNESLVPEQSLVIHGKTAYVATDPEELHRYLETYFWISDKKTNNQTKGDL